MANTIMMAKNTFAEGLIMDFAPDNTQATCMTSALNATLLTFNGNEMSLLNDMGNGRVETARLPEGYIPVGTCEFGDIIYIVSYNPLTDKSQIGCFPSPERNISSEEIGNLDVIISSEDFQKLQDGELTGELVASSCKKILYENSLNPGDKYIIYNKNNTTIENSINTITDVGNTSHIYGTFPKLLKIHIVSIEDGGKINFLDSSIKWYDKNQSDYFILSLKDDKVTGNPDIDSYRSLVSSAYSIFLSKISGKLALLIELEKINSFSCTYDIYPEKELITNYHDASVGDILSKKYHIYWNISWGSDNNNVNPKYLVLTKSEWSGKLEGRYGKWYSYDKVNNEYRINYDKVGHEVDLPPISFRDSRGNLQENYWYTTINRSYEPEKYINVLSFDKFLSEESYEAKLNKFLENVKNNHSEYLNQNLNKLNINRDILSGEPMFTNENNGMYYINLKHRLISDNSKDYEYYTSSAEGTYKPISPIEVTDDIANNYFKSSIYKYFSDFIIPYKLIVDNKELILDTSNLIYKYNITPAMPYGLLEEFTQEGYIDFSKIGSGEINLTGWKYYNTENLSTLNIGLEVYPEANKGIAEIVLEFYDNLGKAAAYHISDRSSYSGNFTEYIPLNGVTLNYRLTNIDSDNNTIVHAGTLADILSDTNMVYKLGESYYKVIIDEDKYYYLVNGTRNLITYKDNLKNYSNSLYRDDSGVIYSGILYLVKIIIKYCSKDVMGEYIDTDSSNFRTEWRWYWTNTLLNDLYFLYSDFNDITPALDLDVSTLYSSGDSWKVKLDNYEKVPLDETSSDNNYVNLSAIVQSINLESNKQDNIEVKLLIGLQNDYNSFSIAKSVNGVDYLNNYSLNIVLGKSYIKLSEENVLNTDSPGFEPFLGLFALYDTDPELVIQNNFDLYGNIDTTISSKLHEILKTSKEGSDVELWSTSESYKEFKNKYSINFSKNIEADNVTTEFNYIGYNQELLKLDNYLEINIPLSQIYDTYIPLMFTGVHYSKYYKENNLQAVYLPTLSPLINTLEQLETFGITIINNLPYFKEITAIKGHKDGGGYWESGTDSNYYINKRNVNEYSGIFLGNAEKTKESESTDNDGEYALFKRSTNGYKIYNNPELFKDYLPYLLNLVLISGKGNIVLRRNIDGVKAFHTLSSLTSIIPSPMSGSVPDIDLFENGQRAYIALAAIDANDLPRIINNIYNVAYNSTDRSISQYLNINDGYAGSNKESDISIGLIVTSILSNIFVYDDTPVSVTIPRIRNIAFLEKNTSSFIKDIIYTVTLLEEDHSKLLLMQGIQLSSYIDIILQKAKGDNINMNNVTITINSILKNMPLLIDFNYIRPSTIINNSGYNTAIRLGESNIYLPINGSFNKNTLWTVNRNIKDSIVVNAANIINSKLVTSATKDDSGFIKYTYDDTKDIRNPKFSTIFKYTDKGLLRLKKEEALESEVIDWGIDNGKYTLYISGVSMNEYLDNHSLININTFNIQL